MNNTIELAKKRNLLIKSIHGFEKKIISMAQLCTLLIAPFVVYYITKNVDLTDSESIFITFLTSFIIGSTLLLMFFEIANELMTLSLNKTYFYSRYFSHEEQQKLSEIFQIPFKNILKQNKKDIEKKLKKELSDVQDIVHTKEYVQSLKEAIESNPEHEHLFSTLENIVRKYNAQLKKSKEKYSKINNMLSEANVSRFKENHDQPLKIIEQE